ncbi:MAG TPA: helix-turn-helix transcriptional regulator [Bacteroidia bacterium]|nr:helix-turn-helix transcriptional regulator [Bacteroidia bacterium]
MKECRERLQMPAKQVALKTNLTPAMYQKIELGEVTLNSEQLVAISKVLKLTNSDIIRLACRKMTGEETNYN